MSEISFCDLHLLGDDLICLTQEEEAPGTWQHLL